jgi:hypothetical protein
MKHLNYLLGVALLLLGFSWASAETVSNYTVDFNTTINTSSKDFRVAPGWSHIVGYTGYGSLYSYYATSGVDGTGTLYCGSQQSTLDYLVTPAITGSMTIQVKLSYNGTIQFYAINEAEDGTLTPGDLLLEKSYSSEEGAVFAEMAISNLNGQRVGIVGKYAYLDNFAVNGTAEIVYMPGLTVTREGYTSWIYPNCDVDNHFTYEFTNITVTNTGERDIALGEEGFSISIAPQNKPDQVVKTLEIPVALAMGESYTFESIMVEEAYDASWTEANGRKRMDIYENMGGTSCTGNWIQPNPYLPGMSVKYGTNDLSEAVNAGKFGGFGMIGEATSRVATVKNTGAAPLVGTVTLTAEGCFSIDNTTINLAAGESADYTLTASAETPGIFTGELVFAGDGVESVTIPLSATVLDATKFFEPFTNNASSTNIPEGWYAPTGNWTKTNNTNGDNNYAKCGLLAPHKLITPLLKVTEGEKMTFEASKQSGSSEQFVNVYYSADREEWTLVKEIPASEMEGSYGNVVFKTFVVEGVPAGDYYIAFESGYCLIDNVYGFERVPVDYDVVVNKFDIPGTVMANNDVTAKVTLQNLLNEAVAEYAPALYFAGVKVAEAEPVEIPANGTAVVEFTFVPNEVGTFPAKAEFVFSEDYTVTTNEVEVTVNEESANTLVQVGNPTATGTSVPVSLLYNNSESETIYTAEQLGIDANSMITSLTYKGYSTGSKTLTPTVTIWLANADDATLVNGIANVPLYNTDGMTKVFEEVVTFEPKGSSSETVDMLVANLSEPFMYTGGNLRVIVRSVNDDWTSFYFEYDGNVSGQCVYRRNDNQDTFLNGTTVSATYNMPVVYLGIQKEAVTYSGVVNDTDGNPLEGVTVTLTSQAGRGATAGPAVYTATTDEEGKFEVNVVQADKTYDATFSKDGYKDVNIEGIDFADGSVALDEPVVMELDNVTGVNGINAGKTVASVKYYNVAGQAADKAFQGVNIVVTTYTDGTTQTVKVIK